MLFSPPFKLTLHSPLLCVQALNELDKRGVTEDDPRRLLLQRLLVTEQGQDEDGGGASPSASGPKLPAALSARLVKGLNDAETGCIRAQVLAFRYLSRGLRLPEQVRYNLAQQVENHSHVSLVSGFPPSLPSRPLHHSSNCYCTLPALTIESHTQRPPPDPRSICPQPTRGMHHDGRVRWLAGAPMARSGPPPPAFSLRHSFVSPQAQTCRGTASPRALI